jgi:hypothetical protein
MTTNNLKPGAPPATDEDQMARYGITRVPVDYFHFKGFRYTSLADAVAQAQLRAEEDATTPRPAR